MSKKNEKKTDPKKLAKELLIPRRNGFGQVSEKDLEKAESFSESYKKFLDHAKTEREAVKTAVAMAEKEGFAKFVSIQGHYNLIFREEEREMVPYCREENIALTPYSALAGGRLAKHLGETSKRLEEDSYAKFKYDKTKEQDEVIISRVAELADQKGISMTEIALAWLLTKVTAPVVGATKFHHIEGAAKAVEVALSEAEIAYLEEAYVPHSLVGVMAQNSAKPRQEKPVWSVGDQTFERKE